MIKQKFKLSEYKKPTFLQQYIDRGIIECSDIQFVDFTKINIKRHLTVLDKVMLQVLKVYLE